MSALLLLLIGVSLYLARHAALRLLEAIGILSPTATQVEDFSTPITGEGIPAHWW